MKNMKRFLALFLVLAMALSLLPTTVFATEAETEAVTTVGGVDPSSTEGSALQGQALRDKEPERAQAGTFSVEEIEKPENVADLTLENQAVQTEEALYTAQETVRVLVVLEEPGLLEAGFDTAAISGGEAQTAKRRILDGQTALLRSIDTLAAAAEGEAVVRYNYTVAVNGMALELPYGALAQVQALEGVKTAFIVPQYDVPEDMSDDTASPLTHATSGAVGATQTWDIGYTGAGMRIAVIDTGLDVDHPSFAAAPAEPSLGLEELETLLPSLNAARTYNGLTAAKVYYSEKLPYTFNYVDGTLDVTHDNDGQGDHGTHVAGIAAANKLDGTDVVGVAPDAQLLVMKVFGASGGAYFDDILAALEDCFTLNVDVANLSLGTPAGFSHSESAYVDEIFARILESDMVVAISAGNSNSAALMNGWGTDRNLTSDPDNGITSSPSTYMGAISVASVENVAIRYNYVELDNGVKVPYNDVAATALTTLYWVDPEHRAEYVMVPGYGTTEDFAGLAPTLNEHEERVYGVSIAVIQRGGTDFLTKQTNAALAGFDACIIYDNVAEDLLNMVDAGQIPNVFVSLESGLAMAEAAGEDGRGILYLKGADETANVASAIAGQMSDFSSWGVTPDLQLAPEVTAPGGNIYSTLTNGHYGMMSGTSMASPQIAGMGALVLEYLHETYPDLTDAQLHTVAEALIMSTAVPVEEFEGIPYSPRKQGAGSANVWSAVNSPVYLTVEQANGEHTPKVSFGDDDGKTGVYTFRFELNNLTDEARRYGLAGQAMTDQFQEIDGMKFMTETSRALDAAFTFSAGESTLPLRYDYNADGYTDMADVTALLDAVNGLSELKDGFDLSGDGLVDTADVQLLYEQIQASMDDQVVVEVPANGSLTVTVTLTLSAEDKAYMDENYPNGIYVDAFVRAYAMDEGCVDLSLPILGFYGDWSAAPAIDDAWYYDTEAVADRYVNVLFTDYGSTTFNLGLNPYIWEGYDPTHNVLSPNGDGYNDKLIEIYLGMMRNTLRTEFTWLNEEGETLFRDAYDYSLKKYYFAAYDIV
ncbi:MAG: S8 family serine peptidase, partial [Oscillospiraceae bacterium]|nr:S8 family serine peptidase [Oscillospiraceae bacterium]